MRKQLRLRETIPTPKLKGIFFNLANANIENDVFSFISDNKATLNVDYYEIYSRDKLASNYFNKVASLDVVYVDTSDAVYIDNDDYVGLSQSVDDIYDTLSDIVIARYKDKWDRIYNALVEGEYNVLDNYNMVEVRTPDLTDARTLDLLNTLTKGTTDTRTLDLTDERTPDLTDERTLDLTDERTPDLHTDDKTAVNQDITNTENVNRFGYDDNGANGSPYEKKTTTASGNAQTNYSDRDIDESGTDTTTHTGTDTNTHTGTDTNTHTGTDTLVYSGYDTNADTGTDTTTHTGTETLTRRGNIGVTTSQQMLESELKLRALYNMVIIIYDDIDKVLTNPIFIK